MKILIINYRYFVSGGPERYLFNLKSLLEEKGHKVIPFSVRYKQNIPSEYDKYFVAPLSSEDEVYFKEQTWNFTSIKKTLERVFYSREVYDSLSNLIKDTKPDFAIVLHYLRKLSPSVLNALSDQKIPFVVRLSDFAMVCPNAHLLRDGKVCELCITGNLFNSVKYKCVQKSYNASLVNYLATAYHCKIKVFDKINYFVVPSEFTMKKMVEGGWEPKKMVHLPTLVNIQENLDASKKLKQIIFIGRLDHTKGVHILLEAMRFLKAQNIEDYNCLIAGSGEKEYIEQLNLYIKTNGLSNVMLLGNVEKEQLYDNIKSSMFSIAPSLWYENIPNSVLESMAQGTPVIASNHGSYLELVKDGETGLLFEPGNVEDLSEKIKFLFANPELCREMGDKCIKFVKENNSAEVHYEKLMDIYSSLAITDQKSQIPHLK